MFTKNNITISLFILFASFSKASFAQQKEDLIGDWKIVKVALDPNTDEIDNEAYEKLTQIWLTSTFHFKNNNLFSLDSPEEDFAIIKANWSINATKKYININERLLKGKSGQLMGIYVLLKNGRYSFIIDETPLILSVVRM